MPEQHVSDRLAAISARLIAWRDRDASGSGDTFEASEFDINAPDSYWLLEQVSDYSQLAHQLDAIVVQQTQQIGALRAEQARLRAENDLLRDALAPLIEEEELTVELQAEVEQLRAENERLKAGWQPIETMPTDGSVILRPHRIWGAMDVRCCTAFVLSGKTYEWMNGDYTTAWPDEALLPFWMPLPEAPST